MNNKPYDETVIKWSIDPHNTLKTDELDKLPKVIKEMIANHLARGLEVETVIFR